MADDHRPPSRVLVAGVTRGRGRGAENAAKAVAGAVQGSAATLVRSVTVKGERQHIRQLIQNVSNDNEADAIVMVGGAGIGQHDDTCEAIDSFVDRRMEGFGEAYRRLLEAELGARAMLARATAGVYNQCLVYAMSGREAEVRRALEVLILPTLGDAIDLATGRAHHD